MTDRRLLSPRAILFVALLALHAAPIWYFRFIPTQDGPSHLYNAKVLAEIADSDNPQLRQAYRVNLTPFPNWTSQAFLASLIAIGLPPLVAEKMLLTLIVSLLPLSMLYLLRALDPRNTLFCLFGFILAYNQLHHMGFHNFCLGVSVALFAHGYWLRRRQEITPVRIILFQLLFLATYLTHFFCYAMLLIALAVTEIHYCYLAARQAEPRPSLVQAARPLFRFSAYALPAYAMGAYYYLSTMTAAPASHKTFGWLFEYLLDGLILFAYAYDHGHAIRLPWLLFLGASALTVVLRARRRRETPWVGERDVFLILAAAARFFSSPNRGTRAPRRSSTPEPRFTFRCFSRFGSTVFLRLSNAASPRRLF